MDLADTLVRLNEVQNAYTATSSGKHAPANLLAGLPAITDIELIPMPIPIQMATMSQNHLAVEQLAQNNKLTEADKIGEVAKHFEAMLLRQFLNEGTRPM